MKYKLRSISPLKGMVQLQGEKVGLIGERRREVTKMHSLQKISLQKIFLLQVRQRPTAPASLPVANDCPCLYLRLRIIERTSCALLSGYCVISASPPGGIPSGWVRLLLVSLWLLKPGNMDGMAGRAMAVFFTSRNISKNICVSMMPMHSICTQKYFASYWGVVSDVVLGEWEASGERTAIRACCRPTQKCPTPESAISELLA